MKISERTLSALQKLITGNELDSGKGIAPYQSGPQLVKFFNEFGFNDFYPQSGGFPSRWMYCEDNLRELKGSDQLASVIESALDPRRFLDTEFEVAAAAEYLNDYLKYDGYEVRCTDDFYRVFNIKEARVEVESKINAVDPLSREFMHEQLKKCDAKLDKADFDGAITNARSLVEAVLTDLEQRLAEEPQPYDGNLPRLYKRVRSLMNLDPAPADEVLRPILSGLISVISGLASSRNKMSDAHVRTYRPERHHAKLAVNAAKTFVDFVIDSHDYQNRQG